MVWDTLVIMILLDWGSGNLMLCFDKIKWLVEFGWGICKVDY